jgi:hypothetical protein
MTLQASLRKNFKPIRKQGGPKKYEKSLEIFLNSELTLLQIMVSQKFQLD